MVNCPIERTRNRIGGDEFIALIHEKASSLDMIMDKLHAVAKDWKGNRINGLSLSVGYASHQEFPDASIDALIKIADNRMYEAKRAYYQSKGLDRRNQQTDRDGK